jgi:hypothetical protein
VLIGLTDAAFSQCDAIACRQDHIDQDNFGPACPASGTWATATVAAALPTRHTTTIRSSPTIFSRPTIACEEWVESRIELFRSIYVFGKWPNNALVVTWPNSRLVVNLILDFRCPAC